MRDQARARFLQRLIREYGKVHLHSGLLNWCSTSTPDHAIARMLTEPSGRITTVDGHLLAKWDNTPHEGQQ